MCICRYYLLERAEACFFGSGNSDPLPNHVCRRTAEIIHDDYAYLNAAAFADVSDISMVSGTEDLSSPGIAIDSINSASSSASCDA